MYSFPPSQFAKAIISFLCPRPQLPLALRIHFLEKSFAASRIYSSHILPILFILVNGLIRMNRKFKRNGTVTGPFSRVLKSFVQNIIIYSGKVLTILLFIMVRMCFISRILCIIRGITMHSAAKSQTSVESYICQPDPPYLFFVFTLTVSFIPRFFLSFKGEKELNK